MYLDSLVAHWAPTDGGLSARSHGLEYVTVLVFDYPLPSVLVLHRQAMVNLCWFRMRACLLRWCRRHMKPAIGILWWSNDRSISVSTESAVSIMRSKPGRVNVTGNRTPSFLRKLLATFAVNQRPTGQPLPQSTAYTTPSRPTFKALVLRSKENAGPERGRR